MMENNIDIDPLDATELDLTSPEISEAIDELSQMLNEEEKPTDEKIIQSLRHT